MNTIRELWRCTGKSQGEFARYLHIPVQTLQEWEQEGHRKGTGMSFFFCPILEIAY